MKRLLFLILALTSATVQAATSLEVVLPAMAIRDVPFTFTVTARSGTAVDAAYLGTVHFSSSDPGATLPADYTFTPGDSGTHQFSATMPHPDPPFEQRVTRTITATDVANGSIHGSGPTEVWWDSDTARHFHIVDPGPVPRGTPFQTEVWALNASMEIVTSFTGTVHFKGTNGLTVPADYTFTPADQGQHAFTFTATNGGEAFLSVTQVGADSWVAGSRDLQANCTQLTATASNGGPVCPDEHTSSLHATSNQTGVRYEWTRVGSLVWSLNGPDQTNIGAGTYNLVVQDSAGCTTTAQTIISTQTTVDPIIAAPSTACGNVHAQLTNPSPFANIEWLVVNGTIVSGQGTADVEVSPSSEAASGGLWIRLTATMAASGCKVESSSLRVDPSTTWTSTTEISTAATTCPASTEVASVKNEPGATYGWSVAGGAIVGGQGTNTIRYLTSGGADVTLSVVVTNGPCSKSGRKVVPYDSPSAFVDSQASVCAGGDATISVALTGNPPFRIVWSDGTVQDDIVTTTATRTVSPQRDTTYSIASISDARCSGTGQGSATVSVQRPAKITSQPVSMSVTGGGSTTLEVAASGDDVRFNWYRGVAPDRSQPVVSGAASRFTTPPLTTTTSYWVEAWNACSSDQSRTAVVVVGGRQRAAHH